MFTRTSGFLSVSTHMSDCGLNVILPRKLTMLNGLTFVDFDALGWSIASTVVVFADNKEPVKV